jgi:hypothetical protein
MAVKARVVELAELSRQLTLANRNIETGQLKEEVERMRAECEQRVRVREMAERRRLEGDVEQLRVEIEAL